MVPPSPHARPECLRCRAYYVTYDPERPHGCRAFGFRSRDLPRDEVRRSSGRECQVFEPRPPPAAGRGPAAARTDGTGDG